MSSRVSFLFARSMHLSNFKELVLMLWELSDTYISERTLETKNYITKGIIIVTIALLFICLDQSQHALSSLLSISNLDMFAQTIGRSIPSGPK